MSGYKTFAIAGAGDIGAFIVDALLSKKNAGIISSVIVLSRSVSCRSDMVLDVCLLTHISPVCMMNYLRKEHKSLQ